MLHADYRTLSPTYFVCAHVPKGCVVQRKPLPRVRKVEPDFAADLIRLY
jgi:hypothetical protein